MKDTLYIQIKNEYLQMVLDQPGAIEASTDEAPTDSTDVEAESEGLFAQYQVHWILAQGGVVQGTSATTTVNNVIDSVLETRGGLFGLDVVLILQGSHVLSTSVNIPSKQSKHIAQALPFMLEDNLAEDVELLHFAASERDKDGNVGVLSISSVVIDALTQGFDDAGLSLTAMIPDMRCLPSVEGEWLFVTDGHKVLARTSQYQALSIELDALPILLNSLFPESDGESAPESETKTSKYEPPAVLKVRVTQEFKSDNFENWLKTQITSHLVDIDTELDLEHIESTEFLYLCDNLNGESIKENNLLVGSYKPLLKRAPSMLNWKPPAILFSIFLCLFVGFQYVQASKLEQQAIAADSEAKALYRKYFPRDKKVFDVKKQMKSHLMNSKTDDVNSSFLPLLALVGEKMNEMNRGKKTRVIDPLRVSFDEAQGELKIDCTAPGFNDFDDLKKKLETLNLSVEIARASQDGDKFKARLNVRSAS